MFCAELFGTTRNFFLFLNLAESLCSAQGAEHGGTSRLASRIVSNPVGRKRPAEQAHQKRHLRREDVAFTGYTAE